MTVAAWHTIGQGEIGARRSCRGRLPIPLAGLVMLASVGIWAPAPIGRADPLRQPSPGTSWQWQLSGAIDLSVDAAVYDVDLFATDAATVDLLHARGRRVICYLSAGPWEDWRPDRDAFSPEVIGKDYARWPGEKWLDIRRLDLVGPPLTARLDVCRAKGFDAVEPDNVDGFEADSGFPLSADDQLRFNRWFAQQAPAHGLAVALKNDAEQASAAIPVNGSARAAQAPTSAPAPAAQAPTSASTPAQMYGVTLDSIDDVPAIVDSLGALRHRPTTRIVFDKEHDATFYADGVRNIHAVSGTLGQLLDSTDVEAVSVDTVAARARGFMATLGDAVDIWEIGNEINGWPWLGQTPDVIAKMTTAFDVVDAAGRPTALTLYYNQGCVDDPDHEMFTWTEANVPSRMRQQLAYVLISYYEDDCSGLQPDWPAVFDRLGRLFPNSKLGFGEVGTRDPTRKAAYMRRYYAMRLDNPAWIGGFFWWWGREDVVPRSQPLWAVLDESFGP